MTAKASLCAISRDINGYAMQTSDIALPFTTLTQSIILTQNVVHTSTVPVGPSTNMIAVIKYTSNIDVWVTGDNTNPVIPTTTDIIGTEELRPSIKAVSVGQTLKFLTSSATTTYVNISYYDLNT